MFNVIFTNNFGSAVAMFRSDEINPNLINTEKVISIEIPELNLRPETTQYSVLVTLFHLKTSMTL